MTAPIVQRMPCLRFALLAALAIFADGARADEVPSELFGSWGVPAAAGSRGSFLGIYANANGQVQADINLDDAHWSCRVYNALWDATVQRWDPGVDVQWDAAAHALTWAADRDKPAGERCSLRAVPDDGALDVTFTCARECSGAHAQRLERLSAERLLPPPRSDDERFCASHDPLRQSLCRPGSLQQALERVRSATEQLHGLADANDPDANDQRWGWDEMKTLQALLDHCAGTSDPADCVLRTVNDATAERERKIAAYQRRLGAERASSDAARNAIDAVDATPWNGRRQIANERFVADLMLENCNSAGCSGELGGATNYTFGYAERRGGCNMQELGFAFTAPDRAYAYVEPYAGAAQEHYPQDATPFVNYCRIDLTRLDGGDIALALRGPGCANQCEETQGDFASLAGTYRTLQKPSFACDADRLIELHWDEQALCLEADLAALDRALAAAYAHTRDTLRGARLHAFVQFQQAWIAHRGETCEQASDRLACLREAYLKRVNGLKDPPPES